MLEETGADTGSLGPPASRSPVLARSLAWVLLGVTFWIDTLTPVGFSDPVLYVAAVLVFIRAGQWWEPVLVAFGGTLLTIAGLFISHPSDAWDVALWNRPLAILMIWITAGLVAHHRATVHRWQAQERRDRTAREQSLQRMEEMQYALDQAAIVATTDHTGRITYVNDKFCEISKYPREELLGQDHRIINSAYHPKAFMRGLWRTIAQGRIWRGEIRNRAKDGSYYWVDTTIVPLLNEQGKPRQYLAIRSDITQRKAAEAKLAEQSALAQLGQLAAVVAHEVRNPLAGVKGTLQVLRSRPGAEPDRAIMDAMIARLDVLNTKVDDILRFAKPRSPLIEAVDLRAVLVDAVASARAAAGAACPDVVVPAESGIVRADREMLRDVLLNLVLNACQSGSAEPIEISIVRTPGECRIEIADRGAGFGEADPERLFEAFHTTKKSGTGLGLAIVRRLVGLQGGMVRLLPREGGGATAQVVFPVAHGGPEVAH
jgi:two-component system CheB/CheR fusion protein